MRPTKNARFIVSKIFSFEKPTAGFCFPPELRSSKTTPGRKKGRKKMSSENNCLL